MVALLGAEKVADEFGGGEMLYRSEHPLKSLECPEGLLGERHRDRAPQFRPSSTSSR